jgi:PTH1 family peptidyl-tRNA hydrolase
MILIAGLGNPGKKYGKTRHNIGFRVVDLLAKRWEAGHFDVRFEGEMTKVRTHGQRVLLIKPQTFMNLSGSSVAACAHYHEIPIEQVWIVHDELDLPLGRMRVRIGGRSGGHNGVKSVIERLESEEFVRFRIGIGRPKGRVPVEDYVVQPFASDERAEAQEAVERAADAIEEALHHDLTHAMNIFNR